MTKRTSNQAQRNTVALLIKRNGDSLDISFDALMSACDAGLINFEPSGAVVITDAGHAAVANDETKKAERNQQARSRYGAARSLGLRRTADGWE